jgi:hypothetical protein
MTKVTCTIIAIIVCFCLYNNATGYYAAKDFYPTLTQEIYLSSKDACAYYHIDWRMHLAIGWRESRLRNVRSYKNGKDYGVFQVRYVHCRSNPQKLMNIRYNAFISARILRDAIDRSYDVKFALARYNAGNNADLSKYKYFRTYVLTILDNAAQMGYICKDG